jgi:hypothetical protein
MQPCNRMYYSNVYWRLSLELLMMSGVPLETCWAFSKRWNNKFYYKVASCWLFLVIQFRFHFILCPCHFPHIRFRSTLFQFVPPTKHKHAKIQGEHNPSLITNIYYKKTTWNKNIFFFQNVTVLKKFFFNPSVHFNMCSFCYSVNV